MRAHQGVDVLPDPVFISVVIVNYNSGEYLQAAVSSLARQTYRDFEVIIVDNASSDGSVDALDTQDLPDFRLFVEDENHGFAGGNNLGADAARGKWVVLLNPDAVAEPDWLEEIVAGTRRHPDVACFASLQLSLAAPDHIDSAGDCYLFWGTAWRGGHGRSADEVPEEGLCFAPSGASAVYRRDVFQAHGGFDERFFCYCEDVDLGFRMIKAGEDCVFLPKAVVHHAGAISTGRHSAFTVFHMMRNRLWAHWKAFPAGWRLMSLPGVILITVYLIARRSLSGEGRAAISGTWEGLKGLPKLRQDMRWHRPKDQLPKGWARIVTFNPVTFLTRRFGR